MRDSRQDDRLNQGRAVLLGTRLQPRGCRADWGQGWVPRVSGKAYPHDAEVGE